MPTSRARKGAKYTMGRNDPTFELELPSLRDPNDPESEHNMCLARRPGVQGLIKIGVLDSLDSLTSLVKTEHFDRVDKEMGHRVQAQQAMDLLGRQSDLLKAMVLMDKIVSYCVIEPKVQMPPEDDGERDPEVLYTDQIDQDDKNFIMQWAVGGTRDLDSFRKESGGTMDAMAAIQGLQESTVTTDGDR
jgi:hypothetical protein